MHDVYSDFHEYSIASVTPASRVWAERITILLVQWLLCCQALRFSSPFLACFHEYNVFLTSLSGQYRRPHPSPDVVAAEHLIMAKWSILGEWMEPAGSSRKWGREEEDRS